MAEGLVLSYEKGEDLSEGSKSDALTVLPVKVLMNIRIPSGDGRQGTA